MHSAQYLNCGENFVPCYFTVFPWIERYGESPFVTDKQLEQNQYTSCTYGGREIIYLLFQLILKCFTRCSVLLSICLVYTSEGILVWAACLMRTPCFVLVTGSFSVCCLILFIHLFTTAHQYIYYLFLQLLDLK